MQIESVNGIIRKYNNGTCSEEEKELIESWYMNYEAPDLKDLSIKQRTDDLNKIWNQLPVHNKATGIRNKIWSYITVASVLLLIISFSFYFMMNRVPDQDALIRTVAALAVPGTNQATLTLGNGNTIVLSADGDLRLKQSNAIVYQQANGGIVYEADPLDKHLNDHVDYNIISTPKGGMYHLTLSDGTRVTLDAASSIRYPAFFKDDERLVEITGQVYFEVFHDKLRPFKVCVDDQTVEVLGTNFNIDTYDSGGLIKTTLLTGTAKVANHQQIAFLKSGQQSITRNTGVEIIVKDVNVDGSVAWKNGLFWFEKLDLRSAMLQFSRWYNIQVVFQGNIPKVAVTAKISRNASADHVLGVLKDHGIRFKLEGTKLIVLEK